MGLFVVDLGPGFEDASVLVTFVAAAIAILIFSWTRRQSSQSEQILKSVAELAGKIYSDVGCLQRRLARLSPEDVGGEDEEDEAAEGTLPPEPGEAPATSTVHIGGKDHVVHDLKDVPLRVVADLVGQWENEGRQGRWSLGQLEYALRRLGRGNHPWLLHFRDENLLWKVSYGGQGKQKATVTSISLESDAHGER